MSGTSSEVPLGTGRSIAAPRGIVPVTVGVPGICHDLAMTDPRFEAMDDDELIVYLRSRAGERHRDTSWPAVSEITERFARLRATKPVVPDGGYPTPGESWGGHWAAMRWPFAEKVELIDGSGWWQGGPYGEADFRNIERAFPGWVGYFPVSGSDRVVAMRPGDESVPWPPPPPQPSGPQADGPPVWAAIEICPHAANSDCPQAATSSPCVALPAMARARTRRSGRVRTATGWDLE